MRVCRVCGCTDLDACFDPATDLSCSWTEEDLCSVCAALPPLFLREAFLL